MLHIPLACLMYQRGFHVLHGSAINYKNKTYLFIGRSGVGKSYIASEIIKLGGKLISEDICVIDFVKDSVKSRTGINLDLEIILVNK